MTPCEINLGRDWIVPEKKRRRIHRIMQFYLTCSAVLTGLIAYDSFLNLSHAAKLHREADTLRGMFGFKTDEHLALVRKADRMKQQIDRCTTQNNAVSSALPPNIRSILPLLAYMINHSDGEQLDRLVLSNERNKKPTVEFSLAMKPAGRSTQGPGFMQEWRSNKELAQTYASISPTTTRLGNTGITNLFIISYLATFEE